MRRRGRDHLAERRDAASEIIGCAVDIGDVGVEALGRRLLVQALFEAGDLRHAEVEVSRFERASARLGRAEYIWYPPLWRASLALARGQMQARAPLTPSSRHWFLRLAVRTPSCSLACSRA